MASIVLDNVTVDFEIYGAQRSFRTALLSRAGGLIRRTENRGHQVSIRSLDNVSLEISHGDRIGLVGHNGAGKSTLLRTIAGVYEPCVGRVVTEGRISPLFNTLAGLDMDETGYENIDTCGLFLGMTPDEIRNKTPDIESFSELGGFLSLPVRTYSTGMVLRLGFAVATSIDPEVLLLDEELGTGDARFGERVNQRIDALIKRSSILVVASHSDEIVKKMCNKAILMDHGRVLHIGGVEEVLSEYRRRAAS